MADRLHGSAGQRLAGPFPHGLNLDVAGRGPTYERAQRLLEERRARAQAQLSARTQLEDKEAVHARDPDGRLGRPFSPPDSDDSFAFDRMPYSSGGGMADAPEGHESAARPQQHGPGSHGSSAYAQGTWQQPNRFGIPPGHLEEDGAETGGDYGAGSPGTAAPHQYGQEDEEAEHGQEMRFDAHDQPLRLQDAAEGRDDANSEGRTLAELEQMLNQTIQQFNIDEMRVPTSKDMAFGMTHGEGPFDISDIWAVDSQPSGSQQSASQRQVSQSEGGVSRDDGHEVNSYAGMYGRPLSLSRESSYASGRELPQAHQSRQTQLQQQQGARPASAQPRLPSPSIRAPPELRQQRSQHHHHHQQQPRRQQQQQQQPEQRPPSPQVGPVGRIHSAGGAIEGHRRQPLLQSLRQQSLLAQHGAAQQKHELQPQHPRMSPGRTQQVSERERAEDGGDAAVLRRPSTPTAPFPLHQHRRGPSQPRVSPRYNQPARSLMAGAVSPGRPSAEPGSDDCTFQPRINPRSREIAERLLPVDRDRRLEQLSRPRNDRVQQRCQQLRQAKEEEEMRDCTFQPQTGRPPSIQRLRGEQPVYDRLYNVKPAWQIKREEILREREQAVLASCTFQPQCGSRQTPDDVRRSNSALRRRPASASAAGGSGGGFSGGGGSTPYVPIHQRVADLLRSRNEKLARAQVRMELGSGSVTFQPEINRRSALLAAERQRQQPAEVAALPASERLYRLAQEQQSARRRDGGDEPGSSGMRDVSSSRDQQQPFQVQHQQQPRGVPNINPRSRALAESSDLPQDFLARQAYLAALGHEKRALYRSLLEESTCTFQPMLLSHAGSLNSSGGFGSTPRGRGSHWSGSGGDGGDGGDRLSKLAYEDVQRSVALREALEQHHYGHFTFTPAINERSRRIGRRHSLTDLHRDDERQAKLERLAAAAEAQRAAECTFRPAINPRSASLGRQRRGGLVLASTEGREQANKLRSSILMEARALREYEELKECTFTPAINRSAPKPAGPVAVPGLERHMELKELARRKRDAETARKAEVWNLRPKSPGPPAGITVPRPFSFEARVLPWQVSRAQAAQQQQELEQQQKKALAALKQQRQQHRRDAEERRAAHLQRIMQDAHAAQATLTARAGATAARGRPLACPPSPSGVQYAQQAAGSGSGGGGSNGRRRSVTFQSPSSGKTYGPGSPHGIAEMPADRVTGNGRGAEFGAPAMQMPLRMSYDGSESGGQFRDDFGFASSGVEEELSVHF